MAIVEDEVRNESEEENEIEVVVEEDDGEQDSDSDDDDDEEALEGKVAELDQRIKQDPYNYDNHIELIQALWNLSDLDRWRAAFERLTAMTALRADDWLLRLRTEITLAHAAPDRERISDLFKQAALDCYSIPIFSEWCSWALTGSVAEAREQLDEILRRAGADPFSGKLFWDAKLELEKSQFDTMSEDNAEYGAARERVVWTLEEAASRPLLRADQALATLRDVASHKDDKYFDKIQKQHEAAMEYLQKVTPYEDKLLTAQTPEEKLKIYEEYIDTVKQLSQEDKYAECDSDGILKILYERASTECMSCAGAYPLLCAYARLAQERSSRATYARALAAAARRSPGKHLFWALQMQHAEREGKDFDEVKSIFERALGNGMDAYAESEAIWLSYLEFMRRRTDFAVEADVDRLRRTFRLGWDSLAETWGEEANDCEVPLYWARLEYRRMKDPRQGKEIFEEIFKYGDNKSFSKYWEALIALEWERKPQPSEHKLRDLYRRALRFVNDYPPSIARLWTDYERDYGEIHTMRECVEACETKIKEWRENYQEMKAKMTGTKHKGKQNKKDKFDKKKKKEEVQPKKGKRKSEQSEEGGSVKRKKDEDTEVEEKDKDSKKDKASNEESKKETDSGGVKRSHDEEETESTETKRQRTDSTESDTRCAAREACTLFVSNLEFKVNEQKLRDELSKYGEIASLRVKAGVKAFGGSICYCQYKTPEAVDEALKHDRTPLDGRPMFFSRYSSKKSSKPLFKYATTAEKNKLFVKNLPFSHCTKDALTDIFGKHGKLKDVRAVTHKDGKPKGLAYIEYEDETSAAAALQQTNGLDVAGRRLHVALSAPPPRKEPGLAATLGQAKREQTAGMRRTQISSFIPSVLQKASTSKATNGDHAAADKRPLSNADFRSLLLK